jgi:hypothetical protein
MMGVLFLAGALRSEAVGIVTRRFPADAFEGQIIEVVLQAEPLVSASAFGVREILPEGVEYISSDPAANYSSAQRQLRWGLFFDGRSRPLTYRIRLPTARTLLGWQGWLDEDGVSVPAAGPSQLVVTRPNPGSVTRVLPVPVEAGGTASVRLEVRPRSGLQFQVIEETLPEGWSLIDLTQGGLVLSDRQLRWGPWTDDQARDITYRLRAPSVPAPGTWSGQSTLGDDLVPTQGASQLQVLAKSQGSVIRSLGSSRYAAGQVLNVRLNVIPPESVGLYVVEETLPAGWTLSKVDSEGRLSGGQLVWGVLAGSTPREFNYSVTAPEGASSAASFSGLARFDSNPVITSGTTEILPLELAQPKATRTLPTEYSPGLAFAVQLASEPLVGSTLYLVEEEIPIGCTVDSVAGGGAVSGTRIVWGPYLDDSPRSFSYRLLPSSQTTGNLVFSGKIRSSLGDGTITGGVLLPPKPPKSGRIEQSLPTYFLPGVPFTVTLRLVPESGVAIHLLTQSIPEGWSVGTVTGTGRWDEVQRRIVWGLFTDDKERTVTAEIRPPATARGSYTLDCQAVFDGQARSPATSSAIVANLPPELSLVPAQTVAEDETLILRVRAWDPELSVDRLLLSVTVEPADLFPLANRSAVRQGNDVILTLRPAAEASGAAVVRLALSDDVQTTRSQFDVTVLPVNDTPAITAFTGVVGAVEDSQIIRVEGVRVSDPDLGQAPLEVELEAASGAQWLDRPIPVGVQRLASSSPSLQRLRGALEPMNEALALIAFRPAADFFGTQIIQVRANDLGSSGPGGPQTGVRDLAIEVVGINDPPGFRSLAGVVVTVDEDAPASATSFPGFLQDIQVGPTNENARQLVLLEVVSDTPSLFTVPPRIDPANGRLQFTVAPNASGDTWVQVQAIDNGGVANGGMDRSPIDRFLLRVEAVNDAPVWTLPSASSGTIEDSLVITSRGMRLSDVDVGDQPMDVTLELESEAVWLDRPLPKGLQRVGGSEGVLRWWGSLDLLNQALDELTFRPATNFFGTQNIRLTVNDLGSVGKGGGQVSTAVFSLEITPVNDAPSFTALPEGTVVLVDEDAATNKTTLSNFLTGIQVGPTNEVTRQTLSFEVSVENPNLFSQLPRISEAGELRFVPNPQAWGESLVTVHALDNGGTANGGWNRSATNSFRIVVQAVNDPPVVTVSSTNLTLVGAASDTGVRSVAGFVRSVSVGPADEVAVGQRVTLSVSADREEAFRQLPSIDSDGKLSMALSPYWSGELTLTVTATDDGLSNPPNQSVSDPILVRLRVVPENLPPAVVWSGGWKVPSPASGQTFLLPGVYPGLTEAFSDSLDLSKTTAEWIPASGASVSLPVVATRSGRMGDFAGLAGLELRWTPAVSPLGAGQIRLNLFDQVGATNRVVLPLEFIAGPVPRIATTLPTAWATTHPETGLSQVSLLEDAAPLALDLAPLLTGAVGPVSWSLQQPLDSRVVDAEILGSTLWIRPRLDRNGSGWFQLRADASNGQIAWAFNLEVTSVPDAPRLTAPTLTPLTEGVLWSGLVQVRSVESPGRPVVLRLEGAPSGLQMRSDGWLFWTPEEIQGPGTFSADVVSQDLAGGPESRVTLRFTVLEANVPPVLERIPDAVLREGSLLQLQLSASDVDLPLQPLTFRQVSGPSGLSVGADGLLNWVPAEDQGPGTHVLRVAVSDGTAAVTNQFTVQVREVNELPVPLVVADQTIDELVAWTWTLRASDVDIPVQSLNYGLSSGPSGMSVSSEGLLKWTPSEVQGPGDFWVSWWVSDGVVSSTNRFGVRVREVNEPPRVDPTSELRVVEGFEMRAMVGGLDPDVPQQALRFRLVDGPIGMSMTPEGLVLWRPGESQAPTTNDVWIAVSDGVVWATNRLVSIASELNEIPLIDPIPELTVVAGFELQALVRARDIDLPRQSLEYRLVQAPAGMTIQTNGLLLWKPPTNQAAGRYDLRVRVSDGRDAAEVASVVVVRALKLPPIITPVGDLEWTENLLQRRQLIAMDPGSQGPNLQWTLVQGPPGLLLSTSGLMEWNPDEKLGGTTWRVTVAVANGALSSAETFQLRVLEDNAAPIWSGETRRTLTELEPLNWTLPVADSDVPSQPLTFRRLSGPEGLVIRTNGVLSWTPTEAQAPATYSVTLAFGDGSIEVTNTVDLVVLESNAPPTLTLEGEVQVPELSSVVLKVVALDTDLPRQTPVMRLLSGPDGLTLSSNGVVAWLPSEAQGPGTNRLVVAVSDGVVSITNQWELRVIEVNQAPVPDPVPDLSVAQGVLLEVALTARDADMPAQPLSCRLVNAPPGMTVSPSGLLRWRPSTNVATGSYAFRIEWSDGTAVGSIPANVLLKPAIRPPVIVPIPALSWLENTTNSFRLQALPGSGSATNLVWSLVMGPSGLTVSRSGEVTWMPDERSGGTVGTVAVVVSDGESAAGADFQIRVLEDNQPPALTESPRILVRELERLVWFLKVLDPDVPAQRLAFRQISGPAGLTVSGEGVLSWVPPSGSSLGTNRVWVSVSDGIVSVTNQLEIVVGKELNVAPVWTEVGLRRVSEGLLMSFNLKAVDANQPPQPLVYQLVEGPEGFTVTSAGQVRWRPGESQGPSTNRIRVRVSDGFVQVPHEFTVIVREANLPPVWPDIGTRRMTEGGTLSFTLKATDSDLPAQSLTYRLVDGPVGLTVGTNGFLTWRPTEAQGPSTNRVRVSAQDGVASTEQSFDIVVRESNLPPVWPDIGTRRMTEGGTLSFTLKATDSDLPAQSLTYRLVDGPVGLTVGTNGFLTWSPTEAQGPSTNRVRVSAQDGVASTEQSFDIVVRESNLPPVWVTTAATRRVTEGLSLSFNLQATDPDLPAQRLGYRLEYGPTGLVVATNGSVTWTPTEAQGPSTNRVRVGVSDGLASVPLEFDIVVREANQAPVWTTAVGTRRVNEGALLSFTVSATDTDLPAQPLSYRLVNAPWGMTLSTNGLVSWRPTEVQGPSTNRVRITVGDGYVTVPLEFDVVVRDAITGTPGPSLSLSPRSDGSWSLRVSGIGGARYQVEQLTVLGVSWTPVSGVSEVVTQGSNAPVTLILPAQAVPSRFFRLGKR